MQPGQDRPRADYVLTVKTVLASEVLGDKIANTKALPLQAQRSKKLGQWSRLPAQTDGKPEGRHWYLPGFLEIPYLYCDFLQMESIPYDDVGRDFDPIATLVAPYAEALQASFIGFYGSVGIPDLEIASIENMLD